MSGAPTTAAERSLAGQLLVATSEMNDPRFAETVIYLVKHSDEGAVGLVINKPVAKGSVSEVLKGFGIDSKGAKGEIVVHYGGPVGRRQGFVLHSDEMVIDSSTKVKDGIAMTVDARMVQALALGTGPRQALLIMGYAGRDQSQLVVHRQRGQVSRLRPRRGEKMAPCHGQTTDTSVIRKETAKL